MATLGQDPKRLGIFFFFDAQGVVDSYVETLLTDMVKNLSELVIVVNGELTAKSYAKLTAFTDNIILRENKGLDAWAYKTAMESYGWDRLVEFDEVVLFNATIMGPVYPFEEMFTEMAGRGLHPAAHPLRPQAAHCGEALPHLQAPLLLPQLRGRASPGRG